MGLFIEVIEWREDSGREIVHRFEQSGEIKFGAQFIVTENQWGVFFKDGHALDIFGTGRHTLSTANIPLLVEALKLPFGGKSPFRADAYFVSRKAFTDMRWGTRNPVVFRDPEFSMVRLRAHGRYALQVSDPRKMINTLVGTVGRYSTEDIEDYLRELIVARLNDVLGEAGVPLLDMPRMYDELAEELIAKVSDDFAGYGLKLEKLVISSITAPEDVAKVIDERSGMAAVGMGGSYMGFKAARALGDAAVQNGGDGGAAGQGMGLGVGAGLGMAIPGMMRDALQGASTARNPGPAGSSGAAAVDPAAGFCSQCGKAFLANAHFCHHCGHHVTTRQSCGHCHAELPEGAKFCPECGKTTESGD